MIFFGRKHPIFSSFIESKNISLYKDFNTLINLPIKGRYIDNMDIDNINQKSYFFHSETPLISPKLDIEYIFNIEDQMTLYRHLGNGQTTNIDLHNHPETEFIRYVLEDDRCKKIICHIEQMANALPNLLKSNIIKNKTEFQRIGIPYKNKKINNKKENFTILFTNSFHNWDNSFFLRGGHFLLQTFFELIKKYPNLNLILRSSIPKNVLIPNIPNIKVIKEFLSEEQLEELYTISDVYVLPACRVHSHSICQAFSYGLPIISTNGWGIEEYVIDEYNGLIIKGFENISYNDKKFGCLENYNNLNDVQLQNFTIRQLHYYLEFLINNPEYLNTLKQNCEITCQQHYSLDNWNDWKM